MKTSRPTVEAWNPADAWRRARVGIVALTLLGLAWGIARLPRGDEVAVHPPRHLAFEANRGQLDAQVRFRARGAGYTVFLASDAAVLTLRNGPIDSAILRLRPVGASRDARLVPEDELPGVVHAVTAVPGVGSIGAPTYAAPTYARVRYAGVYPGIDLAYYGGPRALEYDFVVAPGADPGRIALAFDGAERLEVDAAGELVVHTAAGELRQPRPVVYQGVNGARRAVAGDYVVDGEGHVGFRLGPYDASRPLVIDPVLAYSSYLGGLGDESDAFGNGQVSVAVDGAGNVYVAGTTSSIDFPTTPGALAGESAGGFDVFVTKLSPDGVVLYSTYLGGPCDDVARDVAVDADGNAYVTGRMNGGGLCFADVQPGVLVAKLAPTGALVYGSVIGGTLADASIGQAIAVDATGHAYVTGIASTASYDFPTTAGALRPQACGGFASDGFVAKLAAEGNALEYSTFLCGGGDDSPSAIAVDAAGAAFVGGTTGSSDFPTVAPLQATRHGGPVQVTGFVSKLAPDGSHLLWSTYLGGSGNDRLEDLAVDAHGDAYVTGETDSEDFPTTPGVLQEHAGNRFCLETCSDAFVTKIDANGTAILYSTYLFGELDDAGTAIAVDDDGHAFVAGATVSNYFPHMNAFQATNHGLADAFVAELSRGGTRLLYASYLGGSKAEPSPGIGWDVGSGIALDGAGNAWVAGYTQSYDFPTTPNAFQQILTGTCDVLGTPCGDAFVAQVTADGPGVLPPVSLIVATYEYVAGRNNMKTTWAGLPAPGPNDHFRLSPLGDVSGDLEKVAAWWPTNGAAAGQMALRLPEGVAPGEYEMRLISTDPNFYGLPTVVARSEPVHVVDSIVTSPTVEPASTTTTTTIPPVAQCEIDGPRACDTGDPCTVGRCVPGVGCVPTPVEGFSAVTCACERAVPDACTGEPVPPSIVRRHDRSCGLIHGGSSARATKRLRKAVKSFKGALAGVARARKSGKLSPACVDALGAVLGDAKERAERFLAARGTYQGVKNSSPSSREHEHAELQWTVPAR
jgi:Beta-propeller repeat